MDIPNIKEVLRPEDIWDKVCGCIYLLIFVNGIIYAKFRELTWKRFFHHYFPISIMAIFGSISYYLAYDSGVQTLRLWYFWLCSVMPVLIGIVLYVIRKRSLKPLKEIYEAYYWLITSIPPFALQKVSAPPFETVPKLIIDIIQRHDMLCSNPENALPFLGSPIDCIITIPKDPKTKVLSNSPCLAFRVSDLFEWCLSKDIPRLHTWDGKEITGENDKRRLLDELSTETKKAGHSLVNTLSYTTNAIAHLSTEHNENLKKLGDC